MVRRVKVQHIWLWRTSSGLEKTKRSPQNEKFKSNRKAWWWISTHLGLYVLQWARKSGVYRRNHDKSLQRNIKSSASKLGLRRQFIFQDDNDPKHKAKLVQEFLKNMKINRLEWPAQSPDLNRIEHLWDVVEREIRKFPISNKNQLKTRITEAWGIISENVTNNLVDSMPRRCQAVIAAKGGPTKY